MPRRRKKTRTFFLPIAAVLLGVSIFVGSYMFAWLFRVEISLAKPVDLAGTTSIRTDLVVDSPPLDGPGR
ncbi:MAG: hypothetical protein HY976_04150 [Candidatus Kerfeldbacteria bacterium]|nr:hypothetical protein [Candidatus Kerfeldbacteria bacterium]